jgi:hypothetical protein
MTDTERFDENAAAENELNTDHGTDLIPSGEEAPETLEPIPEEEAEDSENGASLPTDYEALAREDARILSELFPSLRGIKSITELKDPLRYAALRDLGLSPKEAYLATGGSVSGYDNRSHLFSTARSKRGSPEGQMTHSELEAARELFSGLSDREIHSLYKKVTK